MKKLNLENVQEVGSFESPKAGGYIAGILDVENFPEREYLKFTYDIIEGEFKNYYRNLKNEKGWALPTFIKSYKDNPVVLGFFKGMVTSIEESNKGFKWDGETESMFKNKKVGIVLQEEHYLNSKNEEKIKYSVERLHSVNAIKNGDYKVPEPKLLANSPSISPFANNSNEAKKEETTSYFSNPNAGTLEEECPF